jgi:hypothetical protein
VNVPDDIQNYWRDVKTSDPADNVLTVSLIRLWLAEARDTPRTVPARSVVTEEPDRRIPPEIAAEWEALQGTDDPRLNSHSIRVIDEWFTIEGLRAGWLVFCLSCGEPAETGEVCDCGYATCPYCADGRGSGSWSADEACPHWVGSWGDEVGVWEGPLAESEQLYVPSLTREPTEPEVQAAFGDVTPVALRMWEACGFDEQAVELRTVYEIVCDEQDGATVSGSAPNGGSVTSWFVRDPDRFRQRVQELVAQLEVGVDKLPLVMGEEPT